MHGRTKTDNCMKGFTLIELLVVMAVLAILVAVAVPVISTQIEKAREATCFANQRSLLSVLSVQYVSDELSGVLTSTGAITLTEEQKKTYVCPSGGVISARIKEGVVTVDCSKHRSSKSFGSKGDMDDVLSVFSQIANSVIDSGASEYDGSKAKIVEASLAAIGIDLEKMGAVSWKYSSKISGGKTVAFFWWTDQDINELNENDPVAVIRYNPTSGNYSVWKEKVAVNTTTLGGVSRSYKILTGNVNASYSPSTSTTANGNQTYEKALEHLKTCQSTL